MRVRFDWEWEKLSYAGFDDLSGVMTLRAKVIGGWLVRTVAWNRKDKTQSESMVFVPDRDHQWTITKPIDDVANPPAEKLADDYAPK